MAESEGCGSAASERDGPLVSVTVSSLNGRCCEVQLAAKDTVETLRAHVASAWDMRAQQLEMIADVTVPDLDACALDHGTVWTARVIYQSILNMLGGFLETSECDTGNANAPEYFDGAWPEATGPSIRESLGFIEPDDALHLPPNTPANAIGLLGGAGAGAAVGAHMRTSKGRRARRNGPRSQRTGSRAEAAAPAGAGAAQSFDGYACGGQTGDMLRLPATAWGLPLAGLGVPGAVGFAAGTDGLPVAGFVGVGAVGAIPTGISAAVGAHGPPSVGGAAWGLPVAVAVARPVPASSCY